MSLTLDQRRERLRQRLVELEAWRVRVRAPIGGWRCDGAAIDVGAGWPSPEGCRRFTASGRVPEDWPLAATRLRLDVGGESLVTLTYADGAKESFGLDPYHDEFPLAARELAIETESVARAPFGQPVRSPTLARAEFAWIDEDVEALHRLLTQIVEAAATLGGDEAVPHLLEAGETALRALRWPSHTPDYVARLAPTARMQTVWRLPPLAADPPGLDDAERDSVRRATQTLRARLAELQTPYPPRGRIALTGHAHIDLAWLWPYDETRRKLRRTFHTALGLMSRSPDFRFNQSTAHYYAEIEEERPGAVRGNSRSRRRGTMGADRRHVGRARHQHADRRKPRPATALRPALFRARLGRALAGLLVAGLLRLLARPAATAAAGGHRQLLHHQSAIGRRPTDSRTTCSGGRVSTARACSRTCSTIRSPATTASSVRTGPRRHGAISVKRTTTTRRCSRSAMATAAAA